MNKNETIKKIIESKGGKLLSNVYLNNKTKIEFVCNNGHYCEMIAMFIKRGNWCLKCSGHEKLNIDIVKKLAKEIYDKS